MSNGGCNCTENAGKGSVGPKEATFLRRVIDSSMVSKRPCNSPNEVEERWSLMESMKDSNSSESPSQHEIVAPTAMRELEISLIC